MVDYSFENVRKKIESFSNEGWRYDNAGGEYWYEHIAPFGSVVIGNNNGHNYIHFLDKNNKLIRHYSSDNPKDPDQYCPPDFVPNFFKKMENDAISKGESERRESISKLEAWLQE